MRKLTTEIWAEKRTRHAEWLKNESEGERLDLSGWDAEGFVFGKCDARFANFSGMFARGANFSGMDARGADLTGMEARWANFKNVILPGFEEAGTMKIGGARNILRIRANEGSREIYFVVHDIGLHVTDGLFQDYLPEFIEDYEKQCKTHYRHAVAYALHFFKQEPPANFVKP